MNYEKLSIEKTGNPFGGSALKAAWFFYPHRKGPKIREPIQGEFFATDVIRTPAEALIREGIQNSLDARLNSEPVKIRLYVSGTQGALPPMKAHGYFNSCWPHFNADRNGLRDVPAPEEACPFIVFEDFRTTGLQGDPQQWHPVEGTINPFYSFFRTEGRSDKSDQARGRWGVGKFVFPRSSRVQTFLALTSRSDDGEIMLMGQTVLKSHQVGEVYFTGEGDFGINEAEFLLPLEDQDFIEQFCHDFRLERGKNSGLSIVVPWSIDEISVDTLLDAVAREFFFPIMSGELQVTIEGVEGKIELDSESLLTAVNNKQQLATEMAELLKLSQWALTSSKEAIPSLMSPPEDKAPRWFPELFPESLIPEMRTKLEAGERIALRIPLSVKEKGKEQRSTFFDVFLERDSGGNSGYPIFIREGLKISDIRKSRARGIRSLVIIKDPPLTKFLGDSENPAHTQWQKDGSNFKGKYQHGPTTLDFVVRSVAEIAQILSPSEGEEDPSLLIDLFSLPALPEEIVLKTKKKAPQPKPGKVQVPPMPPEPKRPSFRIAKISGGFTIGNGEGFIPPAIIELQIAYDIRRGNPFSKYSSADFELDKAPIVVEADGIAEIRKARNRLLARISQPDFTIRIAGFDEKRDLKVQAKRKAG